jgi:hypothetical protein
MVLVKWIFGGFLRIESKGENGAHCLHLIRVNFLPVFSSLHLSISNAMPNLHLHSRYSLGGVH